jgi:hypothetical protein
MKVEVMKIRTDSLTLSQSNQRYSVDMADPVFCTTTECADRFGRQVRITETWSEIKGDQVKKRIFALTFAVGMLIISMVTTNFAQSGEITMRGRIPFDFRAGNTNFPAGEYEVVPNATAQHILWIRPSGQGPSAVLMTLPVSPKSIYEVHPASLVFDRYGDLYFLSQVWNGTDVSGYGLFKSKMQSEVAREGHGTEVVVVAALNNRDVTPHRR